MYRDQLRAAPTDVVLRLRGHALAELQVTPAYLYPLLHASLLRRAAECNQELSRRAHELEQRVQLVAGYDPAELLERALEPQRGPPRD